MIVHSTLFVTERGLRHQRNALRAAPPFLDVVMLRQPRPEELLLHLPQAEFLITENRGEVGREMIAAAPKLKMILRLGSLAFDIDLQAAREAGVFVVRKPLPTAMMVAEHVVMQMLALVKRLREAEQETLVGVAGVESHRTDENTFAYNWSGREAIGGLWTKSVGVLGLGEIGSELARRLAGWGCRLLYQRRRRLPEAVEEELGIEYTSRDALLADSDVVVNLLPYSETTDRSLGGKEFARMKQGAFLVSCGSGSVIDEAALADAVRRGHLAGAALDTFEWEPLRTDNPLRQLASEDRRWNVLLTPHTAAGAPGRGQPFSRAADYMPIERFLRGEPVADRLA